MRTKITYVLARGALFAVTLVLTGVFAGTALSSSTTGAPEQGTDAVTASKLVAPAPMFLATTLPAIKQYLRSIGIDPGGVAIQRGTKNYAGPSCPGAAWNCTTSHRVVQLAMSSGDDDSENRFVCDASKPRTITKSQTTPSGQTIQSCSIVQLNAANARNSATCDLSTRRSQGTITQTCFINQSGYQNSAFARQSAGISASGTSQVVFQTISVRQTAGAGGNALQTSQGSGLSSNDGNDSAVSQNVHQTTCANQIAGGNGANSARSDQSQVVFAQKKGSSAVTIEQNTALDPARCDDGPAAPFPTTFVAGGLPPPPADSSDCAVTTPFSFEKGSANACTRIHQRSCAASTTSCTLGSGKNTIVLGQLESLLANVQNVTGSVDITQGDPSLLTENRTGTDATLDQESSAPSQISFNGLTALIANVPSSASPKTVTQTDFGPRCCAAGNQQTSTADDFSIKGRLVQRALVDGSLPDNFPGSLQQNGATYGDCETTGTPPNHGCTVDLAASNNEDSNTAQCGPATSCHEVVDCFAETSEGTFGFCSNGSEAAFLRAGRR
jgi:hypothetical protein